MRIRPLLPAAGTTVQSGPGTVIHVVGMAPCDVRTGEVVTPEPESSPPTGPTTDPPTEVPPTIDPGPTESAIMFGGTDGSP